MNSERTDGVNSIALTAVGFINAPFPGGWQGHYLVSGSTSLQTSEALDAGCDAVLVTPCSGPLLVRAIERVLAQAAERREKSAGTRIASNG